MEGGGGAGRAREGWRASCRLVQGRRLPPGHPARARGKTATALIGVRTPSNVSIEIRFPGETVFLNKRIQNVGR